MKNNFFSRWDHDGHLVGVLWVILNPLKEVFYCNDENWMLYTVWEDRERDHIIKDGQSWPFCFGRFTKHTVSFKPVGSRSMAKVYGFSFLCRFGTDKFNPLETFL